MDDKNPPWESGPYVVTTDARGRTLAVWSDAERLHVSRLENATWTPLDDATLPPAGVTGKPAITAGGERLCIAWINAALEPTLFVRCRRAP